MEVRLKTLHAFPQDPQDGDIGNEISFRNVFTADVFAEIERDPVLQGGRKKTVFSNERGLCIERRAAFFTQKAGTLQLQDRFLRLDRQDLDRRQVGAVLDDLPFVFDPAFAASIVPQCLYG